MELLEQVKIQNNKILDSEDFNILAESCSPEVLALLVLYYKYRGLEEKSFSLLLSGIRKARDKWELYDLLVSLSIEARKTDQAVKELLITHTSFPENPKILSNLGKLYYTENKYEQAKGYLIRSAELDSTDGINLFYLALNRIALHQEQGSDHDNSIPDISEIQQELKRFKELNPELVMDDFRKGEELLSQGSYKNALEFFHKVIQRHMKDKTGFSRFHKLLISFYFEPEKLDLEEVKNQIDELEEKIKSSSLSLERLNHLGCLYLIFFVSLVKSADEQLQQILILDAEFKTASKSKSLLDIKKKEIYNLMETVKF